MGQSKYTKRTRAVRRVATGAGTAATPLRLALNRDWLISEHRVTINVSQLNGGVDPTLANVDVRDFIATVAVETSDGRKIFLTGPQAYDLGRFTEDTTPVTLGLAAKTATARYSFELHYEMDEALLDLITALRSNELTTLDLVIAFRGDNDNAFTYAGQTLAAAAAYQVNVESYDYEMLADVQFGLPLGAYKHWQGSQTVDGTTAGAQADIQLVTGNTTRFVMIHAYDTTGAAPVLSDGIIGNLRLNINGRDYRVTTFAEVRDDNAAKRSFDETGVGVIDFGDDNIGFLDLTKTNQCRLQWDVVAGAPAGYTVAIAQDYVTVR